jgi:hypothetical protein
MSNDRIDPEDYRRNCVQALARTANERAKKREADRLEAENDLQKMQIIQDLIRDNTREE